MFGTARGTVAATCLDRDGTIRRSAEMRASGDARDPASTRAACTLTNTDDHRLSDATPLLILIAGPFRSGTGGDPAKRHANVRAMGARALSLVALAGSERVGGPSQIREGPRAPASWRARMISP